MDQSIDRDDAILEAMEKHADMVRRICFLYITNQSDVEDAFQEVFLQYFIHYDELKDEKHQKAWLCQVAFNKCKNIRKSFWRRKVVSIDQLEIVYETPEQGELMKEILQLPSDYKEVVYLHYYEGWSVQEIAKMKKKSVNTIYSRLRYAKKQLKQRLGDVNDGTI